MSKMRCMVTVGLVAAVVLELVCVAQEEKKEVLSIKLPKAQFIGTRPDDAKKVNLDPIKKSRGEFMVPAGTALLSLKKNVTSSDSSPVTGTLDQVTDGDKEGVDGSFMEIGFGAQWVQIDLGTPCSIYAIVVWHYHKMVRVYRDVIVQVADDADFITNVRTLFNNDSDNSSGLGVGKDYEYIETNEGKLISGKGEKTRYVRLYSNGNTVNEMNNYTEVEIYGKPVSK